MIDAARMVKRHWNGILRWFRSRIANGIMEAINSLVQAAKAEARGYSSLRNLKAIIYRIAGKLELAFPHESAKRQKNCGPSCIGVIGERHLALIAAPRCYQCRIRAPS
jgi:hypothetical protein